MSDNSANSSLDLSFESAVGEATHNNHQAEITPPILVDEEEEEEAEALLRLSEQARRRTVDRLFAGFGQDDLVEEDDDEDEEDISSDENVDEDSDANVESDNEDADDHSEMSDDDIDPLQYLRRILEAGAARRRTERTLHGEDNEEDENEDEDDDDDTPIDGDDPRADFLRAIGALSGNSAPGQAQTGSFTDAVSRLMGGNIFYDRGNGEINGLLDNLDQREDPYIIMESLNELSERLLMMNAITAERMIPSSRLAKTLVGIMEDPKLADDLELQLVACRCLYNFMEVNLDFIHDALENNAVNAIGNKLKEVSYIDLTEQALQALEMLSRDPVTHGPILSNAGLKAVLQYTDFLTIHAQRKCLVIVSNVCTNVLENNFEMVQGIFENIAETVRNHNDSVVVENGWLAISRIIMSFKLKPELLDKLFIHKNSLLQEMTQIIYLSCNNSLSDSKVTLNYGGCLSLLKSLIVLGSVSVEVSRALLGDCSIGKVIVNSLNKFARGAQDNTQTDSAQPVSIEALMAAPKDLLSLFLSLIGYLLPINYTPDETPFLQRNHTEFTEKERINEARNLLCSELIPDDYQAFINDIWRLLISSFSATMDFEIRRKVLILVFRIVSFSTEDSIKGIGGFELISNMLASITNQNVVPILGSFNNVDIEMDWDSEDKNIACTDEIVGTTTISPEKPNTAKLHPLILLWSALLIAKGLIQKAPNTIVSFLEREGFIDDTTAISNAIKGKLEPEDFVQNKYQISSGYTNKYLDLEFSNEYTYKLTSNKVLVHVASTAEEISLLYEKSSVEYDNPAHFASLLEVRDALTSNTDSLDFKQWEGLWTKLYLTLTGLSSFELISSKIIESLATVFTNLENGIFSPCYKAFVKVFFMDETAHFLVEKLQEVLTRSESFEIVSSGASANNEYAQTAIMAKQVKVRLSGEDETMILSVHAIATFTSVDTFLKQKLQDDGNSIEFVINGEVIPNEITIYGAIYRSLQQRPDEIIDPSKIWTKIHDVSFRKISHQASTLTTSISTTLNISANVENELDIYNPVTLQTLTVLKVLFDMNNFVRSNINPAVTVPGTLFMNWKLTVKLNRQLEEPLIVASGTLPGWSLYTTQHFPFIFPLETRLFFLQSTSFGYSRLIHHWQVRTNQQEEDSGTVNSQRPQLGRPTRHKVRLSRKMILQSAIKVLGLYGSTPGILEIEYYDEVGTGLGPTLEFYATVSREFAKKKLKLWRDTEDSTEEDAYVVNPMGLFPQPLDKAQLASENGRKVLHFFNSLGKFIARALLDSRIIDFHFNSIFLKLVQFFNTGVNASLMGRDLKKMANIPSLRLVDPKLADSIEHLLKYVKQFREDESESDQIEIDGATLSDLSLYFELPGYPEYELIPDGGNVPITASNLEAYIGKILEATLYTGVLHQTKAFMDGFSKVFPINSIILFSPRELVDLFGNSEEDWSVEALTLAIHANHGYTKESSAIKQLINILIGFTDLEKRIFLQFLTGSPKLPIGGFKSLRPELTVVRKHPEDGLKDDDYLPSVMTCANYLKLPNYSTEEVTRKRLLHAIVEGAGAFLLS